jgi:anti-sigma regulatory factor (Ser/Thr protein kinase)
MIHEAEFPAVRRSVPSARRFAAGAVVDVPAEVSDAVALIATELASNSVQHAASGFAIRVEQLPHQIRIEVEDDGEGQPVVGSPGPGDTSGRGLRIVDALADVWGVIPKEQTVGKTVWVTISLGRADGSPARESHDGIESGQRHRAAGSGSGSPGSETLLHTAWSNRETADGPTRRAHREARFCRTGTDDRAGATV